MSDVKTISITDIAEFDSVDVVEILVKKGDEVVIDQPLVTIESDKAMMDYPSPFAGVVEEVIVQGGSKIAEGDSLITLKELSSSTDSKSQTKESPKKLSESSQASSNPNESSVPGDDQATVTNVTKQVSTNNAPVRSSNDANASSSSYISPGTHKYARELGVNLEHVQGSGRKQRIVKEDIQHHVRNHLQGKKISINQTQKSLDFSKYGGTSVKELTKIQKLTADNMLNAWQSIPHVTHFDQADVTQLEKHRKHISNQLTANNIKLTPLVFVAKALVATLKKFPQFNCSMDSVTGTLIFKQFFHIGIAVDTEHGLFVPVLRDVDKKSIEQLAVELVEISVLAKQKKLTPSHMGGASMTISSLGNLGGQSFTPIINPPEVAILGLSKMILKENVFDSNITQQKLLPLSLSYDHRVINGADAARFCTYLKSVLEDIWKLIL